MSQTQVVAEVVVEVVVEVAEEVVEVAVEEYILLPLTEEHQDPDLREHH